MLLKRILCVTLLLSCVFAAMAQRESVFSAMSYVVLDNNRSFYEQVDVTQGGKDNTIYDIKNDYNLQGAKVILPSNCILYFSGGSLINGTINGNINIASNYACLSKIKHNSGDIRCDILADWFPNLNECKSFVGSFPCCIKLSMNTYTISEPIEIYTGQSLKGVESESWGNMDRSSSIYYEGTGTAIIVNGRPNDYRRNISFENLSVFSTKAENGIHFNEYCHNIKVSNVTVRGFNNGLYLSHCWHSYIEKCAFYHCKTGVKMDKGGCTATSLVSCIAYNCSVGFDFYDVTPIYTSLISCGTDGCGIGYRVGAARTLNLIGCGVEKFEQFGIYIGSNYANVNILGASLSGYKSGFPKADHSDCAQLYIKKCGRVLLNCTTIGSAYVPQKYSCLYIEPGYEKRITVIGCDLNATPKNYRKCQIIPNSIEENKSGTFANRPKDSDVYVGYRYFCTDRKTKEGGLDGIDIIYKGAGIWVDALGRVILP